MRPEHDGQRVGEAVEDGGGGCEGVRTGSRVVALTNSATCGRQNSTVANQSPRIVVDVVSGSRAGPTRSRNLRVPRMMTMAVFYPPSGGRLTLVRSDG